MRDKNYVRQMSLLNDSMWKDDERWLYYSWENQKYIIPCIVLCCLCFFLKGGVIIDLMIIGMFLYFSWQNNRELDNNPRILKEREFYRNRRRTVYKINV